MNKTELMPMTKQQLSGPLKCRLTHCRKHSRIHFLIIATGENVQPWFTVYCTSLILSNHVMVKGHLLKQGIR